MGILCGQAGAHHPEKAQIRVRRLIEESDIVFRCFGQRLSLIACVNGMWRVVLRVVLRVVVSIKLARAVRTGVAPKSSDSSIPIDPNAAPGYFYLNISRSLP